MSQRQVRAGSKVRKLGLRGMSLSLGAAMLASGAAFAQTSPSGDVIINTEPDRGGTTTTTNPSTGTPIPTANGVRFVCQNYAGQPTVMYLPENQPNQAYPWAVPSAMGGGWDANRRACTIAQRLESYRPDGLLEMKTAVENGYNTICVTTDRVPSCRIVLTVPQGQDPQVTRDRVFQNLTVADSGQQTQGVFTYGSNGVDSNVLGQLGDILGVRRRSTNTTTVRNRDISLKPFLSPKDGGTGEKLTGGIRRSSSTRPAVRTVPSLFRR